MITIEVVSGISMSETLINKDLTGEVHSVFNKTVNIMTEEKEIFTLAIEEVFDGPHIIKVAKQSFNASQELIGKKVFKEEQNIVIENEMLIQLEKIEIRKSTLINENTIKVEEVNQRVREIDLYLKEQLDTVGVYRRTFPNEVEKTIHQFLISGSQNLDKAFEEDDLSLMKEAIKKLLGLGHGLTPSGDDFLTGVSLIINNSHKISNIQKQRFNGLILKHINQTNVISQNQLKLSMKQQALHPVIDFINTLYENKGFEEIKNKAQKVLLIGSSSGSDIVFGVLKGIEIINKKTKGEK